MFTEPSAAHTAYFDPLFCWRGLPVRQFRAYQYGGPQPTVPLAHAFPGVSGRTRRAWRGTKAGQQATGWWAAIVGHRTASVITIHGPEGGVRHGAASSPPPRSLARLPASVNAADPVIGMADDVFAQPWWDAKAKICRSGAALCGLRSV